MSALLNLDAVSTAPRSLHELERMRALLASGSASIPLFGAGSHAQALLARWSGAASRHGELLVEIATRLAADESAGTCLLIEGLTGAGKTHLLLALAAALIFEDARPALADVWGFDEEGREALLALPRAFVVPVPLAEHRGQAERLEDIFFAAAERELRRSGIAENIALASTAYAIRIAEEYLLPSHADELNADARALGYEDWQALVSADPALAAAVVERLADALDLPAPLVPSRTERLAMLLEALPPQTALVWLADDLLDFLTAAGPKAARDDFSFLEFIAQRSRIADISLVATGRRRYPDYAAARDESRSIFDQCWSIEPSDLRPLLSLAWRDQDDVAAAVQEAMAHCRRAWGQPPGDPETMREAYPFHPLALRIVEKAGARALGMANFALRALQRLADEIADRPRWQLIGMRQLAPILLHDAASHARGEQVQEVLDYFDQRAGQLWPTAPDVVADVIRCLVCAQLAGEVLTARQVSQALGLDARGLAYLSERDAEHLLGAMVHAGPYIRRVQTDGHTGYLVVWRLPAREQALREFERIKSAVSTTDPQLVSAAVDILSSDESPLADLASGATAELTWRNAVRFAWVEVVDARTLTPERLAEHAQRIASPDEPQSAVLLLAMPFARRAQLEAWRRVAEPAAARPGGDGLLLWLPRELSDRELEPLRSLVACARAERMTGPLAAELAELAHQERAIAATEALSRLTVAYFEGQVLSARGIDLDPSALSRLGGDWASAIEAAVAAAFERVHPQFPAVAPRRPLTDRAPIDLLYEKLIQPGELEAAAGDAAAVWADAVMVPLGLVRRENGRLVLSGRASPVVRPILDTLWARDTTPPHQVGRLIDCTEAARVIFKSPLGLPPELFELCLAALCRLGYLIAYDDADQPQVVENVPAPFAATVRRVARAPLLTTTQWQTIGRLLRAIGYQGVIAPGHEGQQEAWDRLVHARREWLELIQHLRDRLGELWEALDQGPDQWQETLEELDAAEQLFKMINPDLPAALGLAEVAQVVSGLIEENGGAGRLARFLSHLRAFARFLDETMDEVVGVYRYLMHPRLVAEPGSDVDVRRRQLLEHIASGEGLIRDITTFRRLRQVFFVVYARRYMSWHARVYRSSVFEACEAVLRSPDFRALERLGRLRLDVTHSAAAIREQVEQALASRCTYTGLDRALRISPVCPECGLGLGERPDLPDPDELREAIHAGLREYSQALAAPELRERMRRYIAALPHWGDLTARLLEILNFTGALTARQVLAWFTDDVITHLNRILAGQILVPKDLGELRRALRGRLLTPDEAREIIMRWLEEGTEDQSAPDEGEVWKFDE